VDHSDEDSIAVVTHGAPAPSSVYVIAGDNEGAASDEAQVDEQKIERKIDNSSLTRHLTSPSATASIGGDNGNVGVHESDPRAKIRIAGLRKVFDKPWACWAWCAPNRYVHILMVLAAFPFCCSCDE
jgi:hypothetical protein